MRPDRRELSVRSLTVATDGESVGRGYLLRDVTRQAEVERVKASILATVSHELRTPLAAIKGFASALLHEGMEWDRASQRDFITQIEREADPLTGLVRNLLDMSRLEAGTLQFEWERCDLAELVQDLVEPVGVAGTRPPDPSRRDAADPRWVVDRRFLERVIWNLIDNAAKYSPPGSPVTVRIARDATGMRLSVADQGIGIAVEERERIFERFVRGARVGKTGGTGLGLAICRAIVEVHGGTISVESEPGEGSVFTVWLPPPVARGDYMMRRTRVLVVDDEVALRKFVTSVLGAAGYEVVAATDGEQALAVAEDQSFDLVVLDLMLPGIDGLDVYRRLRETSDMPIIVLSAKGEEVDKVDALNSGADDYLTKPFGVSELLAEARQRVRRRRNVVRREDVGRCWRRAAFALDPEARQFTIDGREIR